ncbi:MAG: aminoglycoside phosphotransferase family protein [Balneolaceae bacterium]|nr:aminoglycoside phosphotransferase family protein [Balneolaceae bacterium]
MDKETVFSILKKEKLITGSSPEFKPLKGGVSSEIFLVTDGNNRCVVKQALPKLKVDDDWFADISRNENEQEFLKFLQTIRLGSVPKLLYRDKNHHFFVMEYLDEKFQNWKKEMLDGVFNPHTAKRAAELLAEIHLKSWEKEEIKRRFQKSENFYSLRTEPYLVTTGKRHPELKDQFFEEAERLKNHQQAIVHGDFSPKNIMVKKDRIVLLDHEVAWFGDPAFDVAFFINHLYLKMLVHFKKSAEIQDLTNIIWTAYFERLGNQKLQQMEPRIIRLLLLLMLARIDGKSPVEYLEKDQKEFVRSFVKKHLRGQTFLHAKVNSTWKEKLKEVYH